MKKTRLEAFTDGVMAIVLTIMVLELKIPHDPSFHALVGLIPVFMSYVLSFLYIAIYWNNHHHLFQIVDKVSGRLLWANMILIFWLTLIPFTTGWMSENHAAPAPVFLYGINLLCCSMAYMYLVYTIIGVHGKDSTIAKLVNSNVKIMASNLLYVAGIALSFFLPWVALLAYAIVALIWIVPDRKIENELAAQAKRMGNL